MTATTAARPRPSPPAAITITRIGVHSSIVDLGRNADGTIEVPQSFHEAGWYKYGVAPGQIGPAIFLGHVDSTSGPGVFYKLGAMLPGDHVDVQRQDGKSVTYIITAVRQYAKTAFPTIDVYKNTPIPTIRLITCGGAFDPSTHHYLANIVAYGEEI